MTSFYSLPRLVVSVVVTLAFTMTSNAQDLLVRYTFDESDGGDAIDSGSSPPANGVLQPGATRTTNTPGGFSPFALDLSEDGIESYVDAGDVAKVDTMESFTLTTWLYLEGLNSDQGGSGNVRLLAKQADTPNFDGFSWNLNNPNAGARDTSNFRLGLFIGGVDTFDFAQSDEDIGADNQWTFLAVSYDGTTDVDNMIFYWGDEVVEVQELGFPGSVAAGPLASSAGLANFGIGFTDAAPDIDFAADGFQDDVRVYSGVLTLEQLEAVRLENLTSDAQLQPGDADQDFDFDQLDIVRVSIAAKYLSGQVATWGEGDWDGAPGGAQGNPPAGNGLFDQVDIIAALSAGKYLTGPYAALSPNGELDDEQTSLVYDARTGELRVDAPASTQLTSIFVTSEGDQFVGDKPPVLDGPFDSFGADNIFKSTIGGSFGDSTFGNVLPAGLGEAAMVADLSASGSLAGGGGLGEVDFVYIPEPSTVVTLLLGLMFAITSLMRGHARRPDY